MARRRLTQVDLVQARLDGLHRRYVYGPRVRVDVRPGVIAFLQPMQASGYPGALFPAWAVKVASGEARLRFASFKHGGQDYKLVQFCGGRWEIYRVDAGMETFLGYDSDVLPSLLRGAVCPLPAAPEPAGPSPLVFCSDERPFPLLPEETFNAKA